MAKVEAEEGTFFEKLQGKCCSVLALNADTVNTADVELIKRSTAK